MKTYALRLQPDQYLAGMPEYDNGQRTLRVYQKASSLFILASCARRKLRATCAESGGAFVITVVSDKSEFEAVRSEFNGRPR